MKKFKIFNVIWEERHSIDIEAKNEEKAIEKVNRSEYDEAQVNTEISSPPEAFEMD